MRKTLVAEKRKADMAVQVERLSGDINSLNAQVEALKAKCEALDEESNAKKTEEVRFIARRSGAMSLCFESDLLVRDVHGVHFTPHLFGT